MQATMQAIPSFANRHDPTPVCEATLAELFGGFEPPSPDPAWLVDDGGPWWVIDDQLVEVYAACHPAYVPSYASGPSAATALALREPSGQLVPVGPGAIGGRVSDAVLDRIVGALVDLPSRPGDLPAPPPPAETRAELAARQAAQAGGLAELAWTGELLAIESHAALVPTEPTVAWNVRREVWDREPTDAELVELRRVGMMTGAEAILLPVSHEPHRLPKVKRGPRAWLRKGSKRGRR